ncbi:hypothetical protein XENOCAPTIV_010730, partial [Xenoophorus captivus]
VAGLLKDRDFALVGRTENGPPLERGRSLQVHLLASRLAARSLFVSDCLNMFRSSVLTRLVDFLLGLGCEELAAQFLSQEIDGQALLLLREDHLISTMNIKLGPALKICASINSLRE